MAIFNGQIMTSSMRENILNMQMVSLSGKSCDFRVHNREHPGSIAFDLPQVIRLSIRMARGGRSLMEFTGGRKSLLDGGGRKPPEMVAEVLNLDIFRD